MTSVSENFIHLTKASSSLVIESIRAIPELTALQIRSLAVRISLFLIPIWICFLGFACLVSGITLKVSQAFDLPLDLSAVLVGISLLTISFFLFFGLYRRILK